ncbi:MAG: hypothetical protein ACRDU7_02530, partial [Acidimicrobiia bacterium]
TPPSSVTNTTTTEASGPIGETTTTTPSNSGIGSFPPPKATSAVADDLDSGPTAGQGEGDSDVTASSQAGNEASPWPQFWPVSALASLPWWGQVAVLSAGMAVLFFVTPLIARWFWNLSEDQ